MIAEGSLSRPVRRCLIIIITYIELYPVKIYKLAALYIINIKIRLKITFFKHKDYKCIRQYQKDKKVRMKQNNNPKTQKQKQKGGGGGEEAQVL